VKDEFLQKFDHGGNLSGSGREKIRLLSATKKEPPDLRVYNIYVSCFDHLVVYRSEVTAHITQHSVRDPLLNTIALYPARQPRF